MHPFAALFLRALHLVALALAPPFLSPAPAAHGGILSGAIAALVLAVVFVAALRLRGRLGGQDGLATVALFGAAIAASLIAAGVYQGDRAPIGRGVLYVAVPLWCGIAVVAATVAARLSGRGLGARLGASVLVLGGAAALFVFSGGWLGAPERMWLRELHFDGDDRSAVDALTGADVLPKKYEPALSILNRCLTANPGSCACLARRTELVLRAAATPDAIAPTRAVRDQCPSSVEARATLAEAIALYGDAELAEQEARAGLEKGDDGHLRYALALALDRSGRHAEALDEAKRAVALGAGRNASILVGWLAINAGDLDAAAAALRPLVASNPDDGDAQYDLALVADKRDDFNLARQGYLAALRADPRLASARYNLALLTLRVGAVEEARHHAEAFASAFPGDPRGAMLARRIASGH